MTHFVDVHADGGDLARRGSDPEAGQAFDRRCLDVEWRQRADQGLLEVTAVLLHVLPVPSEVEDRVADELSWAVVGRLPAAVGLDDLDLGTRRHVELALLGAAAERDHGRVLEQHDGVGDRALRDRACERALQLPRLLVRDGLAQVEQVRLSPHTATVAARCD